jgi:type II secretory pathway component PulJ
VVKDVVIACLITLSSGLGVVVYRYLRSMQAEAERLRVEADRLRAEAERLRAAVDVKSIGDGVMRDVMKHVYLLGYDRIKILR